MDKGEIAPQAPRGLDMSDLDHVTPAEIDAFRAYYIREQGRPHEGWQFFLENNPGAMKRFRLFASFAAIPFDQWLLLAGTNFANVAWYAQLGFDDGIRYIVHLQQKSGRSTRAQVMDGLAISLYYSGPAGAEVIARALRDHVWLEPDDPVDLTRWRADRELLMAGLDYSTPELLPGELEKIEAWNTRAVGRVPEYVRLLSKHRPAALKAHRNRYENLLSALPVQILPLSAIKVNMYRANPESMRDNINLARYLGVSKDETILAAISGMLYGYEEAATMVERVAGDIFDEWA